MSMPVTLPDSRGAPSALSANTPTVYDVDSSSSSAYIIRVGFNAPSPSSTQYRRSWEDGGGVACWRRRRRRRRRHTSATEAHECSPSHLREAHVRQRWADHKRSRWKLSHAVLARASPAVSRSSREECGGVHGEARYLPSLQRGRRREETPDEAPATGLEGTVPICSKERGEQQRQHCWANAPGEGESWQ